MKILSSISLLFLVACGPSELSKVVHKSGYENWRQGKFYYNDEIFGKFEIYRTDSLQVEKILSNGLEVVFSVNWLNDSVYNLKFAGVKNNPNGIRLPDDIDSLIKTCTITEECDTSYNEKATSNLNKEINYTLIKVQ